QRVGLGEAVPAPGDFHQHGQGRDGSRGRGGGRLQQRGEDGGRGRVGEEVQRCAVVFVGRATGEQGGDEVLAEAIRVQRLQHDVTARGWIAQGVIVDYILRIGADPHLLQQLARRRCRQTAGEGRDQDG